MFKWVVTRLPWRGEEVKARMEARGRDAARIAAEFVAGRARSYCPVDTGELLASIKVVSSMNGTVWHVVATARHARPVEFGSLHGNRWIAPNPFMRRALADGRAEFPEILKSVMVGAGEGRHLGATIRAAA